MQLLKKPAVAAAIAAIVLVGGLFLGANRSAARVERGLETAFYEGVDGSGYGIGGLLADRVEYAGYLTKVAQQYGSLAPQVQEVTEACEALRETGQNPRALFEANAALTDAVTGLDLAMQDTAMTEQHDGYRAEYVTELTSYNQRIAHLATDYNAKVRESRQALGGFPVAQLTFGRYTGMSEELYE